MKKEDKKIKKPYITIEEVTGKGENSFNALLAIAKEIKSQFDLNGGRDEDLIYKILENSKKNEKNNSGDNR